MPSEKAPSGHPKKAIVFLTNFWDANTMLGNRFVFLKLNNGEYCKINFIVDKKNRPQNYEVHSIALQHPPFDKLPHVNKAFSGRIDAFCPNWNILNKYHDDKDWDSYTIEYVKLLKSRRNRLKEWADSLDPKKIYFLCCWENTSGESKCHRQLVHKALRSSKSVKSKIVPIYRNGAPMFKSKSEMTRFSDFMSNNSKKALNLGLGVQTIQWRYYPSEDTIDNTMLIDNAMILDNNVQFAGIDAATGMQLVFGDDNNLEEVPDSGYDDLEDMNRDLDVDIFSPDDLRDLGLIQ